MEAELFDGTVLEFPDGTAPDVIQRVVKTQTAARRQGAAAPAAAPPVAVAIPPPAEPAPVYQGQFLPLRKMSDGSREFAMPRIVSDTLDALRLPERVADGQVDPMSDEGMRQALGLASLVTGGAVPKPGVTTLLDGAGRTVPKAVTSALKADGVPLGEVASRVRELGPAGVVADLGPNSRYKAAALATRPGEAQTTVVDAMRQRQREAPARLTGALDETLGPAPVPSYVEHGIRDNMRTLGPEYDQVLAGAPAVDTTPVAAAMDQDIGRLRGDAQTRLRAVRTMLDEVPDPNNPLPAGAVPALDTNPETLHQTRQAIDGMLENEQDGNVRRVLQDVRENLSAILGGAVPDMARIDAQYSELGRQRAAVGRGQTVLDNGREAPRPAELRDEVAAGPVPTGAVVGPSGVAFRLSQGARAEIDRLVGTKLNDRAALNSVLKGESDWNYDRLTTLFGRDTVDRLYRVLDNERAMAETENMALSNSKTAGVQAAQKEIGGSRSEQKGAIRSAFNLNFGDAIAGVADKLTGGYSTHRRANLNEDIAQALMSIGNFNPVTASGVSGAGLSIGALVNAIMQSAPAQPAAKAPISEEEFMRAMQQGRAT